MEFLSSLWQSFYSRISQLWNRIQDKKIVMIGLDAAGKSTVLYKMKLNETVTTIPTVGFNVETVQFGSCNMTMWDIGGQDKIRKLWNHYYLGTHGIIFVVDSNDQDRLELAREELRAISEHEELRCAALLVLANKQDLPQAMACNQLAEGLKLQQMFRGRDWYVQSCCATNGDGLHEGLDWLTKTLAKQPSNK